MEKRLGEILKHYEERIVNYEAQKKALLSKMEFYKDHILHEEHRIASVKYQTIAMCVYHFRAMHTAVQELLNAWEG